MSACSGADLIVSTFLVLYRALAIAEKSNIPLVEALTFPIRPTTHYSCPYLTNGMPRLPFGFARRWSHELFLSLFFRGGRSDLDELRRHLGL